MCMMAMGIIGVLGSVIGGVISAMGAQQQAEAEAQAAEYQAAIERNRATAAAYEGVARAEVRADQGEEKLASQRAAYAASGVTFEGTPLTVFGETAADVGMDVRSEQYAGRINAQAHQDQANLLELKAKNSRKAGQIAAMSGIIGGISGVGKAFGGGGAGSSVGLFG